MFVRSGFALLLVTGAVAATPSLAYASGVAYPDADWTEAWIQSPSSAGTATLHADVLRPKGYTNAQKTPVILSIGPYFNHSGQLGPVGAAEGVDYNPVGPAGPNDRFFAGDVRLALRDLVERAGRPDVCVVDPPRAGLSQKVVRRIVGSVRLPILAGLPLLAIQLALLEWFRGAELSCDRAAAIVTRDPLAVCRSLMVISAGEAAEQLSLDAFINQAMDYSEGGKGLEKLTRMLQELGLTHPMPVRRVRHLLDWVREGGYDRIVGGEYIRRGEEPPLREETDAASAHYAERVRSAFRDAGESIADVGRQLGDWLSRQRD